MKIKKILISSGFNNQPMDWAKILLAPFLLFILIFFAGFLIEGEKSNTNDLGDSNEAIDDSIIDKNQKPATDEEIHLYRQIGVSNLCMSRQVGTDFAKSIAVSAKNYALIISSKHGGYIEGLGAQKLSDKQMYNGSILQILDGAIKNCPEMVPEKDKKKFFKTVKELNKD